MSLPRAPHDHKSQPVIGGHLILVALLALAGGPAWPASPQEADVPRIFFDSDMSSDHDDVGDIAVLHGLASMGECQIIGMAVSSQNGGTALCMDAINTWYGKPNIPIGVRPDVGGVGEYAGIIASEFPHGPETQPKDFPLAVAVYRQQLAASPDHSVIIATTGYLNNLMALLQSAPDQYSALNGMDLVKLKVKLWACAGGAFPSGDEFNLRVEPAAAAYVVNNWPVAVTYTGFDVGQAIYTGGRLPEATDPNPIKRVYVGIKNSYPYPSWGQIAIYQSVRGTRGLWGSVNVGHNTCQPDGHNAWATDVDPNGAQDQQYLLEVARTPVRAGLDAMMMLAPNNGTPSKPGEPSDLRLAAVGGNRIDLSWTDNAYNETGFVVERRNGAGAYVQIATVGANVTTYSDTGLASTANASYRVKATNAQGDSLYATTWLYSGWTETNLVNPADLPLYTYYQTCDLRMRSGDFRPEHVTVNNDSSHGKDVTVDVDVSALGQEGNFHVYFLYQDVNNWYRLNVGEKTCQFEKKINGTITAIGAAAAVVNLGNGSPLHHWRVQVANTGAMTYIVNGATVLSATETLALSSGKLGLGGWARTPVWENFNFDAGGVGGAPVITQHPSNQSVASGAAATFSVTATGAATLTYQWQKNNANIAGATSATVTTPATTVADNGATYRVVVTNGVGSVTSTSATLSVTGAGVDPVISKAAMISDGGGGWGGSGNTADKAYDGNTSTFYDAANGDSAYTGIDVGAGNAATVTSIKYWARAGWTQRMIGGVFEGSNSPTSGYVTLGSVATASDTAWTTIVVNGAAAYRYLRYRTPPGGWCNVAEIEFHGTVAGGSSVAPSIQTPPLDKSVQVGQTATFSVTASGTAPLSYQWQKNGTNIGGATSVSYTTPATVIGDSGATFRVVVSNDAGSATSNNATLTVSSAPLVDSDGDGLPDDWELAHFNGLGQGPDDDPDHDGATNLQEYLAGTDPMDPNSVPPGTVPTSAGSGGVVAVTGDSGGGGGGCHASASSTQDGAFMALAALTVLVAWALGA